MYEDDIIDKQISLKVSFGIKWRFLRFLPRSIGPHDYNGSTCDPVHHVNL